MSKNIRIIAEPARVAAVEALVARARRAGPEETFALLGFAGREDYLGFVAAWKVAYADLVAAVHRHKRARRAPGASVGARASAQIAREEARGGARAALSLRAAGKAHARAARAAQAEAA